MATLTTHVLDTMRGRPAMGLRVELWGEAGQLVEATTNEDGRLDQPLLDSDDMQRGTYELRFHVGAYFGDAGGFLTVVPVRFTIEEIAKYHVPLLISPYGYATYRGS